MTTVRGQLALVSLVLLSGCLTDAGTETGTPGKSDALFKISPQVFAISNGERG